MAGVGGSAFAALSAQVSLDELVILLRRVDAVMANVRFDDGDADAVVSWWDQYGTGDSWVEIWVNDGSGRLRQDSVYKATQMAEKLFAGDLNGDTYLDLLSVGASGLDTMFNHGDGTFSDPGFPLDTLPQWAQALAQILPLTHLVALVRALAMGNLQGQLVMNLLYLVFFAALTYILAIVLMR